MTWSFDDVPDSAVWVADTGLFVACGRQQNTKYIALKRFARKHDLAFVIPQRVYEELGGSPARSTPGQSPINSAIDAGWVTVADELAYENSTVSGVMDFVRTFIANKSNRKEDQIEKADTALAGVAAHILTGDAALSVCVVTTDRDAGKGCVSALTAHGFADRILFVNGFEFLDEIT